MAAQGLPGPAADAHSLLFSFTPIDAVDDWEKVRGFGTRAVVPAADSASVNAGMLATHERPYNRQGRFRSRSFASADGELYGESTAQGGPSRRLQVLEAGKSEAATAGLLYGALTEEDMEVHAVRLWSSTTQKPCR